MVPLHLDQELFDRIQRNALDDGRTMSAYIAGLLDQYVPRPGTVQYELGLAFKKIWPAVKRQVDKWPVGFEPDEHAVAAAVEEVIRETSRVGY